SKPLRPRGEGRRWALGPPHPARFESDELQRPVVIAVPAVRVMQMPLHEVVAVIGVRDDLVPTVRAVRMALVVLAARVRWRAGHRVRSSLGQSALVDVVGVHVVEMAIVEVVGVVTVPDGRVPAAGPVRVIVSAMGMVLGHVFASLGNGSTRGYRHNMRRLTEGTGPALPAPAHPRQRPSRRNTRGCRSQWSVAPPGSNAASSSAAHAPF